MSALASPGLRVRRRLLVLALVGASLGGIVAGYGGGRTLAWQMFPEASRWQADIVRVTAAGDRHAIADPWPGGYVWSEMVTESGLSHPHAESHAAYGIAATLEALQHALDWVAASTPADGETAYLEAVVRYRHNDAATEMVVLRSSPRSEQ